MKRRFLPFILAALAGSSGCGPALRPIEVRPLKPVSRQEAATLALAVSTGQDIPLPPVAEPAPATTPAPTASPPVASPPVASPPTASLPVAAPTEQDHAAAEPSLRELCAPFLAKLPREFKPGWVRVPEDWDHPEGVQIEVFYYARLVKTDAATPLRPVVFFNGGPSIDSHSSSLAIERQNAAKSLSFIYIDQRGTGCSSPYPAAAAPTSETARRLALYGTEAIVRDAEAIRKAVLGESAKWRVFGQSYGGFVVHRYLEKSPASVDAAFAHGASLMADPVEWTARRMLSQKRVTADYLREYPGDEARLAAARRLIPVGTCFEAGQTRVCGPDALDAATSLLAFQSSWGTLHRWITGFARPDGKTVIDQFVRNFVFGVFLREGFASSVLSLVDMTGGITDRDLCARVEAHLARAGENSAAWPIHECRALGAIQTPWDAAVASLAGQGRAISAARVLESLRAQPTLPFHLYSGQKDVLVPTETFAEEAALLGSRARYVNFDFSGHEGFYTERQVWDDLISP